MLEEELKEKEPPVSLRQGIRGVRRLVRPFNKWIVGISVLGILAALADAAVPYITGKFFDALIALSAGESVMWNGLPLWLALLLAWVAVRVATDSLGWWIGLKRRWLTTNLQPETLRIGFSHLVKMPMQFHTDTHVHEQTEKVNSAGWRLERVISQTIEFVPQALSIIIGITFAYTIKSELANVLAAGVLAYAIVLIFLLRGQAARGILAHRAWGRAWDDSISPINQVSGVKQSTAEDFEMQKMAARWKEVVRLWFQNNEMLWSRINFWQRVIVFVTQLSVFMLSIQYIANGALTIGELVALNGYALMFFGPLVSLGNSWQVVQNGLTAAGRLNDLLDKPTEEYKPKNAKTSGDRKGEVEFENVAFRYEKGQEVLSSISFTAKPGQSIAFVGESGVGKSTIISLISAYYFPTEGRVLVDGVDTREWDLVALRARIAVVPQEVALFNETIRYNIRYGSFSASDESVERAAMQAHIHDFIMKQDKQYDTIVGERGIKLSVGQKQRVAISRAILRNPEFLILDEPTSALDIETEQLITGSLEKLMEDRTTFIIAHRLSTVRKADQILVIKDGAIAEQGNHAELIATQNGIYKRLYELHVGLHE